MTAHSILSTANPQKPPLPESLEESARARKRRKELIDVNRSSGTTMEGLKSRPTNSLESGRILCHLGSPASEVCSDTPQDAPAKHLAVCPPTSCVLENKFLLRYDPKVPMTKEETSAWRKEERRKRNRESAAASRQKTRDRITELEDEVNLWKSKFDEAARRILALEELYKNQREGAASDFYSTPTVNTMVPQDPLIITSSMSPLLTPPQSPKLTTAVVSPSSLSIDLPSAFYLGGVEQENNKMIEGKHFKEIFQQATYEILCF